MEDLIFVAVVVVIMLGGMSMIVGGPTMAGKFYRCMYQTFLERPVQKLMKAIRKKINQLGRYLWRQLRIMLRGITRRLWRLSVYTGRAIWIRFTT